MIKMNHNCSCDNELSGEMTKKKPFNLMAI